MEAGCHSSPPWLPRGQLGGIIQIASSLVILLLFISVPFTDISQGIPPQRKSAYTALLPQIPGGSHFHVHKSWAPYNACMGGHDLLPPASPKQISCSSLPSHPTPPTLPSYSTADTPLPQDLCTCYFLGLQWTSSSYSCDSLSPLFQAVLKCFFLRQAFPAHSTEKRTTTTLTLVLPTPFQADFSLLSLII